MDSSYGASVTGVPYQPNKPQKRKRVDTAPAPARRSTNACCRCKEKKIKCHFTAGAQQRYVAADHCFAHASHADATPAPVHHVLSLGQLHQGIGRTYTRARGRLAIGQDGCSSPVSFLAFCPYSFSSGKSREQQCGSISKQPAPRSNGTAQWVNIGPFPVIAIFKSLQEAREFVVTRADMDHSNIQYDGVQYPAQSPAAIPSGF
ncbi:hypothetical protein PWT90_05532 [Aphanocladium album]|nr:hypothetical protein PWT90_05532 [Aphanocladium album]